MSIKRWMRIIEIIKQPVAAFADDHCRSYKSKLVISV